MKYMPWTRMRMRRSLTALITLVIYFILLFIDAYYTFAYPQPESSTPFLTWLSFGLSVFQGLLFLAVSVLVWLYARERKVALVLYCYSYMVAVTFAVQTGTEIGNYVLSIISISSSGLSLPLLALLVLLFPKNYLHKDRLLQAENSGPVSRAFSFSKIFIYCYLALLICVALTISLAFTYFRPLGLPDWLRTLQLVHFLIGISGVLITIGMSYRQSSSIRIRQQLRLFVSGVVLSLSPLLLFTVLPRVLNLPESYRIDGQFTALFLGIFPIALGYSILRYQILIFDRYIRRAVSWIVGGMCLLVLVYCAVALSNVLFVDNITLYAVSIVSLTVILAPCIWWFAKILTERLFFGEILHYQRLIDQPAAIVNETLDLEEAAQLLTLAVMHTLETVQVCLFVLDETCGYYRVVPMFKDDPLDSARRHLVQSLLRIAKPGSPHGNADWLGMQLPLVESLAVAKHPILLSEVTRANNRSSLGLRRYLTSTTPLEEDNLLLAPVRAQGKMIGLLVLGERRDHQSYGGPDFEIVQLILARFSLILETARLYARANQQAALLNNLYGANAMSDYAFRGASEVANAYALAVAQAATAGAEIWLYTEQEKTLQCSVSVGPGPRIIRTGTMLPMRERDWFPRFYEGDDDYVGARPSSVPECLPNKPCFPFAWLPLYAGERRLGIFVLTYARPHHFVKEEMHVLEMFVSQCAASLENARMTMELRIAYERQKELDRLKDQFIMTASHELRTPLTAVQGYIELLSEYNTTLSAERRANFIDKAHRGCDELALLVGNIMDASRVHIDAENIKLHTVSLLESVMHVLEILEAMTRRERRTISVDVPATLLVLADNMRLRQVLLNLVSNALKYSPVGTNVEISASLSGEEVTIQVRDYGLGVPQKEQHRLFERFVRLDRDMNSPVRGAGLGLYICKQLVAAMGGRIWVESCGLVGEGSVFAFVLRHVKIEQANAVEYEQHAIHSPE